VTSAATEHHACLAETISLSSRCDLFEILDNHRICELSQLHPHSSSTTSGFPSAAAVLRSTGVFTRRILQPDIQPLDLAIALTHTLDQQNLGRLPDFHATLLCHSHTDPSAVTRLASQLQQHARLTCHHSCDIRTFNAGCTGFLQQLQLACQLLHTLSLIHI
jgi:hypothetical protein